ncbi:transketolase-like TK C-terminal-containing protein [Micromonospora sp. DT31]|uniref:transketolase-like TK C-terminal-containing protein n=1 Tax=Micromonospora sp. DT31 TaxID=3393434 RepID=UPI003CF18600
MTSTVASPQTATIGAAAGIRADAALREVEERVLWLANAIVDHANRVRPNPSGLKVGGHQASSASITTIMTALWLETLGPEDRVSVKPHASPVLHALEFLLGWLPAEKLTTLREFGGLQSYPSRLKDPVPADYSTGSVGIGATAPIWGAIARRYVNTQFGTGGSGRQWSLVGDAELDEGAVWEAVVDPMVAELGEVCWVVDLNRQSLDRVVPTMGAARLQGMFAAAGWQVLTVKYGALLEGLFTRDGGLALRDRIDTMTNPEYQRMLRRTADELRQHLPGEGPGADEVARLIADVPDADLLAAVRNLGGHDLTALRTAFAEIDDTRPTVVLAYTLKGYGLATEGHPQNHSALLTETQLHELAARVGVDPADPWVRLDPSSAGGRLLAAAAERLRRGRYEGAPAPSVPGDLGRTPSGTATTQAALGRTLLDLNRAAPEAGARIVTVSPDVSSSTNLGGWVNKVGVWSAEDRRDWFSDDPETILHWRERPSGQHVELGIAEVNLVSLMGELGATWSRWDQPLLPIGVMYDPFVSRALEPWSYGVYAGGQSILVGTPSGVTLAPEGGAHQSITTPSIGLEQPGVVTYEPAFALDTEWCLLASLGRLGRPDGCSAYLRLSTRPVDQSLAAVPTDPAARERRRRQVVGGAYALRRVASPTVTVVTMGAMVTEGLAAADRLTWLGFPADVVVVTSPGLLFRAAQARRGLDDVVHPPVHGAVLEQVFPADRAVPMVTVLDGHPHTLAFLSGVHRIRAVHLGVTRFGQSGDLESVYRHHGIDTDAIVGAALDLVD